MKRRICIVLIMAMVISLIGICPFSTIVYADEETKQYGDLSYIIIDDHITITACDSNASGKIEICKR